MRTLMAQRERLEAEVASAKATLQALSQSECPDMGKVREMQEALTRNTQLIGMIDNHLNCGHQPMWRAR